jgi:hypothetical protein
MQRQREKSVAANSGLRMALLERDEASTRRATGTRVRLAPIETGGRAGAAHADLVQKLQTRSMPFRLGSISPNWAINL